MKFISYVNDKSIKNLLIQHNGSLVYDGALYTFFQQIARCGGLKDTYILVTIIQVHKVQKDKGVERLYKSIRG